MIDQTSSPDNFITSLSTQRDMFVVCDILSELPLDTYSSEHLLSLTKHLAGAKFMLVSKYKKHKIECLDGLYRILSIFITRKDEDSSDIGLEIKVVFKDLVDKFSLNTINS